MKHIKQIILKKSVWCVFVVPIFIVPVFSYADKGQKWLIAQNNTQQQKEELSAYDPFADYSEFEDTVEEQESINFFQNGRFLTLGATGGVRLFTLNMNEFYEIGPVYGGYLDYFLI